MLKMKLQALAAVGLSAAMSVAVLPAHAEDTSSQDKKFVEESGKGSLAEIQMAKLARVKSKNPEVRKFADKMIHDHTMLIAQMKPFAQKMGVPPPSKLASSEQDEWDRLSKKSGESFDKDYVQTMVDDHHKDLEEFTKERDSTANPELKATVAKGTEVIKEHNEMIDGIARQMNLQVPSGM